MGKTSLRNLNREYAALIQDCHFPRAIGFNCNCKRTAFRFIKRAESVREIENSPALIQSIWLTEREFIEQFKARAGYILDAIQDGIIIYDKGFLRKTIPSAKRELRRRGIKRVGRAWVWPIKKAGETIEL